MGIWELSGIQSETGGSDGGESYCNTGDQVQSQETGRPQRKEWLPAPVFMPWEFYGERNLAGCSSWGWADTTESLPL